MTEALTDEILEKGRWLFAQESKFIRGVLSEKALPLFSNPEIAFAGRSNVGKSSLINALTNRNLLARISNTPGRTKELNFFDLGEKLTLVDLPGYGYAKAGKEQVFQFQNFTKKYLRGRAQLRRVYILIDSRHGLKLNDIEVMKELDEAAQSYQLVLTKSDKMKENDLQKVIQETVSKMEKHPACYPRLVVTSSYNKEGIDILRGEIALLLSETTQNDFF